MDSRALITHQKLALTRNPIVVNVDPASLPNGVSRVDLRYFLKLFVQKSFQSNDFSEYTTLEASEMPPQEGSTTSAGAYFELQARLNDLLKSTLPPLSSREFTVCPDLVRKYYYEVSRYNGDQLLGTEMAVTNWAIRAGVSEKDFDMYRDLFFTRYIGEMCQFLTWQPNIKRILPQQPEFLYFITNYSPVSSALHLRVKCFYEDRTSEVFTAMSLTDVSYMTVYAVPTGYDQLGLGSRPKQVLTYELWLSDESLKRVSDVRFYSVDFTTYESTRFILFQNGLGGYDTIPCLGVPTTTVKVERQVLQRFKGYDYLFPVAEELINAVSGEKSLTLNLGGWVNKHYRAYLEDLLFSDEFYLVDETEYVPLMPTFDSMSFDNPREWPIERTLTFRYANKLTRYSKLPAIERDERPTGWREWTTSCVLLSTGVRSGKRMVNELVKYYLDTGENVRPLITKPNVPGTDGYVPPWTTADCAAGTTPYLSAAIERPSTKKRANCGEGQVGGVWTITIPAGAFGSERSQDDADAKAEVRYAELDTQTNADANGTCVAAVPIPIAILNLCPGDAIGNTGNGFSAIVSLLINGVEKIPNSAYNTQPRYAAPAHSLPAGTYNVDVEIEFGGQPTLPYKISLPSKNLSTGPLNGYRTHRFANVVINWGDADLIAKVEPA